MTVQYVPDPGICLIHKVEFVQFRYGLNGSSGCPICVAKIREQVRKARNQHRKGKRPLKKRG
jgi:hypothetical protein